MNNIKRNLIYIVVAIVVFGISAFITMLFVDGGFSTQVVVIALIPAIIAEAILHFVLAPKESNKLLYMYNYVDYVDYGVFGGICFYLFDRVAQWQGYTGLIAFVQTNWGGENNLLNQLFYNIYDAETAMLAFGEGTILINFLFFVSLIFTIVGLILTVKLQKLKLIPTSKAVYRYIWWGIMGPIEALAMLSL